MRSDLEFHRIYEFLSRLRQEFEPRRAQLNARGRVLLSKVLSDLRAEETRLRGAGLLAVPYVLATRGPPMPSAPSTQPRSSVPPLILPTPPGQGQSQHQQSQGQSQHQQARGQGRRGSLRHCSYCNKDGHTWATCYTRDPSLRQQHQARGQSAPSGSSAVALSDQDIIRSLRGLLAAIGSSSTDTAGSVTDSSGTVRPPPSTQSGMSYCGLWPPEEYKLPIPNRQQRRKRHGEAATISSFLMPQKVAGPSVSSPTGSNGCRFLAWPPSSSLLI